MRHTWRLLVLVPVSLAVAAPPALAQRLRTLDTVIQGEFVGQHIRNNDPQLARELTEYNRKLRALEDEVRQLEKDLPPPHNSFHETAVKIVRDKKQEFVNLKVERDRRGEKYRSITGQTIRLHGDWAIERQAEAQAQAVAHMAGTRGSWLFGKQVGPVLHVWVDRRGTVKVAGSPPAPDDVGPAADMVITPGQNPGPAGPPCRVAIDGRVWPGVQVQGVLGQGEGGCVPIPVAGQCPRPMRARQGQCTYGN
jgi:hypothetical protein